MPLLLTLLVGLFFIIGFLIPKFVTNKKKLLLITTSISFVIMLYLLIFDISLEVLEIFSLNLKNILIIIISILLGISILKLVDLFIPEHTHNHREQEDINIHNTHIYHIGLITSISLCIHNILEGMSIYITALSNFKLGLIMCMTVGMHNLPLGMEISVSLNHNKNKSKYLIYLLLIISSSMGAFILSLINMSLNETLEGVLLSITMGMLIYISLFELLKEVISNIKDKETKIGLLIGILLSIILYFI